MRRLFLEIAVAISLTLGAIVSLAADANASDVMVMTAYARASATAVAKSGAAYLTIANHGDVPDRLIGVSAEVATMAHLHETKEEDGVASMRMLDSLDIPAHGKVVLAPGGIHVMLVNLKQPLKKGEQFDLTLIFEHAGPIVVKVPVGGVAEGAGDSQE